MVIDSSTQTLHLLTHLIHLGLMCINLELLNIALYMCDMGRM